MNPPPSNNPHANSGVQIAPRVRVQPSALRFTYANASGPGGQNVNKRATKALLRLTVTDLPLDDETLERLRSLAGQTLNQDDELVIQSEKTRSQLRNRDDCLDRLRELVIRAKTRPKRRRKTKPSRASNERRLREKKHRGQIKQRRNDNEL